MPSEKELAAREVDLSPATEGVVSLVALLAIYLLGVWTDPFRAPHGWLLFVPLGATYLLAFGSFVRRVT